MTRVPKKLGSWLQGARDGQTGELTWTELKQGSGAYLEGTGSAGPRAGRRASCWTAGRSARARNTPRFHKLLREPSRNLTVRRRQEELRETSRCSSSSRRGEAAPGPGCTSWRPRTGTHSTRQGRTRAPNTRAPNTRLSNEMNKTERVRIQTRERGGKESRRARASRRRFRTEVHDDRSVRLQRLPPQHRCSPLLISLFTGVIWLCLHRRMNTDGCLSARTRSLWRRKSELHRAVIPAHSLPWPFLFFSD